MDRKLLLAAVAATTFLGAASVSTGAFGADEIAQMKVALAGVDTRSGPGADQALRRIQRTAEQFCGYSLEERQIGRRMKAKACAQQMTYKAVHQLDAPMVTALYEKHGPSAVLLAQR